MSTPSLIDTHCHVNFNAFTDDAGAVIERAQTAGVGMLNVGTNYATSVKSVQLADQTDGMWAAIGLHPIHLAKAITETAAFAGQEYSFTTKAESFDKRQYFQLAQKSKKVVAIGESGLDYFHLDDFKAPDMTPQQFVDLQKETLYEILTLGRELNLPHIFHCRDAYDDFADLIRDFRDGDDDVRGVVHCFTGTLEQAQKMLDLGFSIGFTGIVTFPNAKDLQEVAKFVPLDRLLLETDSPYLAPQPIRGQRNEPAAVSHVAQQIAALKGLSYEEVCAQTTKNAIELFQLSV
jgi:TatD DNase family protein